MQHVLLVPPSLLLSVDLPLLFVVVLVFVVILVILQKTSL